jgi:hypothetical protein
MEAELAVHALPALAGVDPAGGGVAFEPADQVAGLGRASEFAEVVQAAGLGGA